MIRHLVVMTLRDRAREAEFAQWLRDFGERTAAAREHLVGVHAAPRTPEHPNVGDLAVLADVESWEDVHAYTRALQAEPFFVQDIYPGLSGYLVTDFELPG